MAQQGSCYRVPLKCFVQENSEVSCLPSTTRVEGTRDLSDSWTKVSDANVLDSGIQIVSDAMDWNSIVMDANGLDTLAIAYCMLLNHCIDSVCVGELRPFAADWAECLGYYAE